MINPSEPTLAPAAPQTAPGGPVNHALLELLANGELRMLPMILNRFGSPKRTSTN